MDSSGSGYRSVSAFFEHSNDIFVSCIFRALIRSKNI